MPRNVKEFDERYTEFLDVAQRLFYQKGYDQTTIQDIISAMGVAKGLFYHYFRSKGDLLDALIDRSLAQAVHLVAPLVTDASLDATTKFNRIFRDMGAWKLSNKEFFLELLRVMMRDENVLLRVKMWQGTLRAITPLLAEVIRQGVNEGVYDVDFPDESAQILLEMGQALSNSLNHLLLTHEPGIDRLASLDRHVAAYQSGVERMLGAQPGSIQILQYDQIRHWLEP